MSPNLIGYWLKSLYLYSFVYQELKDGQMAFLTKLWQAFVMQSQAKTSVYVYARQYQGISNDLGIYKLVFWK